MNLLVRLTAGALAFGMAFTLISTVVVNAGSEIYLLIALNFGLVATTSGNRSIHKRFI